MTFFAQHQDALWFGAVAAVPVALLVAMVCRSAHRPATRHALWTLALLTFIVPGLLVTTGWSRVVASMILGAPHILAWAYPPERSLDETAIDTPSDRPPQRQPEVALLADDTASTAHSLDVPASRSLPGMFPAIADSGAAPSFAPRGVSIVPTAPVPDTNGTRATEGAPRRAGLPATPPEHRKTETLGPIPAMRSSSATHDELGETLPVLSSGWPRLARRLMAEAVGIDLSGSTSTNDPGVFGPPGVWPRSHRADPVGTTSIGAESIDATTLTATEPEEPGNTDVEVATVGRASITDPIWNALVASASAVQAWCGSIARAVVSIIQIPAPPPAMWIGGVLVVIAGGGLRTLAGRAAVRRVRPVDRTDRRLVEDLSERLGLRRAPRAYLVSKRLSPMVCGGLNPRIILPEALWKTLDLDARRAVLTHELAHLRRRDQWVRLMELGIGVLYWWHPVLWAVRRQIREEADLCCDAWVTTLFPGLRRSYAEALVRTRCYLSIPGAVAPVAGLGMASARSRRFSRRLTMVMTSHTRPRTSPLGVALALVVGTATLVVVPSLAHATLGKKLDEQPVAAQAGSAPRPASTTTPSAPADSGGDVPAAPGAVVASSVSVGSEWRGSIGRGIASSPMATVASAQPASIARNAPTPRAVAGGDDVGTRVRALEARLESLDAKIERMLRLIEGAPTAETPAPIMADQSSPSIPPYQFTPGSEQAWHSYSLPEGKLEALWILMSRADVPIYVSMDEGEISLQGTPQQQRVFAQFLAMIHPESAAEYNEFVGGARVEWLESSDAARVRAAEQAAIEAQLAAREQAHEQRALAMQERARALQSELTSRMLQQREVLAERRHGLDTQIASWRAEAEVLQARAAEAEQQAAQLATRLGQVRSSGESERLEQQIEALHARADGWREAADALREQVDEVRAALEEAMEDLEVGEAGARNALEEALAELREQFEDGDEIAEICDCDSDCAGEACDDDCDDDCHCLTGASTPAQPAAPAVPARPARPARAATPSTPATPAAPASPRPRRD